MVIIVRNTGDIEEAVMFYTNSQWNDAINMQHGAGVGYTVADSVMNTHNILGVSSETDPVSGVASTEIAPMTHSQVVAVAIGNSFAVAS
jgi:hypothetical protein